MRIAYGADKRLLVVDTTLAYLQEKGHEVVWYGPEKTYIPNPGDDACLAQIDVLDEERT